MKQEQEMMQRKFWDDMLFMVAVQPSWWLGACFSIWQLTLFLGTQNDSISRNFSIGEKVLDKFYLTQRPKPERYLPLMEMAQAAG
jgi:hypothetical protein